MLSFFYFAVALAAADAPPLSVILETDPATIASRVSRPRPDATEIQINEQSECADTCSSAFLELVDVIQQEPPADCTWSLFSSPTYVLLSAAIMNAYSTFKERYVARASLRGWLCDHPLISFHSPLRLLSTPRPCPSRDLQGSTAYLTRLRREESWDCICSAKLCSTSSCSRPIKCGEVHRVMRIASDKLVLLSVFITKGDCTRCR